MILIAERQEVNTLHVDNLRHCLKLGQGQLRDFMYTNFVELVEVFSIYGHGGKLGHVTWTIYVLVFPFPKEV